MGQSVCRRRLKLWVGPGDRRDCKPSLGAGRWWFHWERLAFSFDAWLTRGAVWVEVFRYA